MNQIAGYTPYKTRDGLPALKQQVHTPAGAHETRIEAPAGFAPERFADATWLVARGANVYIRPDRPEALAAGLSALGPPPTRPRPVSANYGISPKFFDRSDQGPQLETNDPALAKVGLGLSPPHALAPPLDADLGPITAIAAILAALGVLAMALVTRRKEA